MDLRKLAEPFPADDIEWKPVRFEIGGDGKVGVLAYITARAIMERLDDVCGPENWRVAYTHLDGGVICHLEILCESGWVSKSDGAESTKVEPFKGGISSALKRAGAVWGIGRYLYRLDHTRTKTRTDKKTPPGWKWTKDFSYEIPTLPSWALPAGAGDAPASSEPAPPEPDRPLLSDAQLKRIHALRRELEIPEKAYRAGLKRYYGVTSTKDLTPEQASELIARLEAKRRSDVDDDVAATFGDGRLGKLRESALGFLATAEKMGTYRDGKPIDLKRAGLVCDTFGELREVVQAMSEESELEDVTKKLEALLEEMSF